VIHLSQEKNVQKDKELKKMGEHFSVQTKWWNMFVFKQNCRLVNVAVCMYHYILNCVCNFPCCVFQMMAGGVWGGRRGNTRWPCASNTAPFTSWTTTTTSVLASYTPCSQVARGVLSLLKDARSVSCFPYYWSQRFTYHKSKI